MMVVSVDETTGMFYRGDPSADLDIIKEVARYSRDWPVRPGDVVLDLGAHIGAATLRALAMGAKEVIAIEPAHENYRLLRANVTNLPVTALEAAVTPHGGPVMLYVNEGGVQYGHSTVTKGRKKPVMVDGVALRDLLNMYNPTVIKCDIEYDEYPIAEQLATLPEYVRVLAMEVHLAGSSRPAGLDLIAAIEASGFRAVKPYHVSPKAWHVNICWERP